MKNKQSYDIEIVRELYSKYRRLVEEKELEPEQTLTHCVEDYIASLKLEIED